MKREERTAITISKIIELGIEEFGTRGYEGASLNRICEQGIPKGLLYHNFKNKDAVYIACVEKCYHDLTDELKRLGEDDSLHGYMQARLQFFNHRMNESNIIFETMLREPKHLTKEIRGAGSCFQAFNYAFFYNMISKLTLREGVTSEDAFVYFQAMQKMFNSFMGSLVPDTFTNEEIKKLHEEKVWKFVDLMLYGLVEREDSEK